MWIPGENGGFKLILTVMLTYKIVCKNQVPSRLAACIHLAMFKIRSYIFSQLLSFMTKNFLLAV